MNSDYDPVFLPNESIVAKKHNVGDVIKMKVTEVMDDGVKCVCSHGEEKGKRETPEKEAGEHAASRYKSAMDGNVEGY
jgi:hypothetical protein